MDPGKEPTTTTLLNQQQVFDAVVNVCDDKTGETSPKYIIDMHEGAVAKPIMPYS